jgi:protocatechuate 3,4-dioxygenase beta subunit
LTSRLVLLAVLAASAAGLAAGASGAPRASGCRPTASNSAGPFQSNHATAPSRSRIGRGHVLSGRVLRYPNCRPLRGIVVELWQESPYGRYDRRGHASVVTSRTGTFRFEGPVPPSEFGRPHIHIRISAGEYEEVITTYFIAPGQRSGRVTIVLVSAL